MGPEFESAFAVSKQRLCKHRCDAARFKSRDAGAAKNQFLGLVGYYYVRISLNHFYGFKSYAEKFNTKSEKTLEWNHP